MASGIFATDIGAPEGPVALPDGSMLVTEMSDNTLNVTHVSATGERKVVWNTKGRPNGLAIEPCDDYRVARGSQHSRTLREGMCTSPRETASI